MIRPLVFLITIESDDLPIRIFTGQHPSFDSGEYFAALHLMVIQPVGPLVQIGFGSTAPGNGIPAALLLCISRIVADLNDELRWGMSKHHCEEIMGGRVMIVLGYVLHRQHRSVEGKGFVDVKAGKLEVIDA